MKFGVSVTLVTSLLLQAPPARARSSRPSSSQLSSWSRVRSIVAGSRISTVYVGRRQDHQYFVSATDETMTMLTPERLPRAARKAVVAIAGTQPGFFTATKWAEFTEGAVRVTPDGVFMKRHRIAALEDIVTTVGRDQVEEVSQEILVRRVPRPPAAGFDPEAQLGAAAGVAGGMLMFKSCGEQCPAWAVVAAFVGPIIAVALISAKHRDRETELVYRAP